MILFDIWALCRPCANTARTIDLADEHLIPNLGLNMETKRPIRVQSSYGTFMHSKYVCEGPRAGFWMWRQPLLGRGSSQPATSLNLTSAVRPTLNMQLLRPLILVLLLPVAEIKRPALQQEPNVYLQPKWLRCLQSLCHQEHHDACSMAALPAPHMTYFCFPYLSTYLHSCLLILRHFCPCWDNVFTRSRTWVVAATTRRCVVVWLFGCLVLWLFGCLLFGCLVVWLFGCLVVWLFGCFGCFGVWLFCCFVVCWLSVVVWRCGPGEDYYLFAWDRPWAHVCLFPFLPSLCLAFLLAFVYCGSLLLARLSACLLFACLFLPAVCLLAGLLSLWSCCFMLQMN